MAPGSIRSLANPSMLAWNAAGSIGLSPGAPAATAEPDMHTATAAQQP